MASWSDAKKLEVVTTYLALGKIPLVEAMTTVPRATIRQWKMQPWWKELELEIVSEDDLELSGKLKKIVDRSLDAVVDRINNGEFVYNSKTGKIDRIPVKLRDVHRVSVDLIDKYQLIRGKHTQRIEKVNLEDAMLKLALQFAEWAKGTKKEEKVIEGEIVECLIPKMENAIIEKNTTNIIQDQSK